MADLVNNFFIPIMQITFVLGMILFFFWFVFRAIYRFMSRFFVFFMKYSIFRKKYDENDLLVLSEYHEKGYNLPKVHADLLLKGYENKKIYEMKFIYKKMVKQLKGGNK